MFVRFTSMAICENRTNDMRGDLIWLAARWTYIWRYATMNNDARRRKTFLFAQRYIGYGVAALGLFLFPALLAFGLPTTPVKIDGKSIDLADVGSLYDAGDGTFPERAQDIPALLAQLKPARNVNLLGGGLAIRRVAALVAGIRLGSRCEQYFDRSHRGAHLRAGWQGTAGADRLPLRSPIHVALRQVDQLATERRLSSVDKIFQPLFWISATL